jgi:hypothetical protein
VKRTRVPPQSPRKPAVPGTVAEFEDVRVLERADGFWVQPLAGGPGTGPYRTLIEAIEAQRAEDEELVDAAGDLAEVERDIGVSDWIDPDTLAPAEDNVPHIEEH